MLKKIVYILLFLSFSMSVFSQTVSSIKYPRTTLGTTIETMYIDSVNNTLYIGGNFDTLELPPTYTTKIARKKIAAIDLATGQLLPWQQNINNGCVYAIEKMNDTIYAGGNFNLVNTQSKINLIAFDKNSSNNNLNITFPFNTSDTVFSLQINNDSMYVGGRIENYNSQSVRYLIKINRNNGVLGKTYTNNLVLTSDYFGKVKKIHEKSSGIYFIAEKIDNNIYPANVVSQDLFFYSFSSLYTESRVIPGATITGNYDRIDDFIFSGTDLYVTGNFSQVEYNNNVYSRDKVAAFDQNNSTIYNWTPPANMNPNLGDFWNLVNDYGEQSAHITSYGNGIFFAQPYSLMIDTATFVSAVSDSFASINNPSIFVNNHISGSFFDDIKTVKGMLVLLNLEIGQKNISSQYEKRNTIHSFCLQVLAPAIQPVIPNPTNTFCKNSSYSFYVPGSSVYTSLNWSYLGSGTSISNNGNDTVTVHFSANALPGYLKVSGVNLCGQTSDTTYIPIYFHIPPNANAGKDTSLNFRNNMELKFYGSSTAGNAIFLW